MNKLPGGATASLRHHESAHELPKYLYTLGTYRYL
jgi:hypothetical protein